MNYWKFLQVLNSIFFTIIIRSPRLLWRDVVYFKSKNFFIAAFRFFVTRLIKASGEVTLPACLFFRNKNRLWKLLKVECAFYLSHYFFFCIRLYLIDCTCLYLIDCTCLYPIDCTCLFLIDCSLLLLFCHGTW